ncbi:hypothetical protein [Flavobacterium sp. J27]|uniref:hypothetical protein n=1 Tax=Flavobacterium sp. J27 TaxID=2060419 RepID=UPI0010300D24|nr:hypothetical protein [Flavobacterium sp. J27]
MAQKITLEINNSNPIELKAKEKSLQQIATLPTDVIVFLGELAGSKKAVDKLMSNQKLIKSMLL